ncbi:hypothetical protein SAMN05661010_01462 [Modicisalibacter muralis]|uniref:AAA+ ATPase domain-containing protein n=1 Tax=Modicisalibacter muralis TaxID=119000 RepID=A0A1G9JGZ3_9GAMM|nr:nucleoside triphosphate hydrolase [Halomonas muralis]SDL36850.1 hypothetical protein SAMN05661010_01462 [Halomonas muralis]
MNPDIHDMAADILRAASDSRRYVVALAGPPGAGKSFLSELLCRRLNDCEPGVAEVVPMDGYHFDNALLEPRGLLPVKGAPETFDIDGLAQDLRRIRRGDRAVAVPVFDRPLDLARAGGRLIDPAHRIVIVEGNYLLLDRPRWSELRPLFDTTILIEVSDEVLEARLIQRWLALGQDRAGALERTHHKDMHNARLVKQHSVAPDIRWR